MFPEARYDDQVDSTVQYLQWMRKTNHQCFRIRSAEWQNKVDKMI
ncbi:MAG: hypothetical protein ACR5LA_12140 [Wolbachia sp.]